jgi:predicted RNase H-like HicB family nuclease
MKKTRYIHWQQDDVWLGYLEEYPDYQTQGETLAELKENLADIYRELTSGRIPNVRRAADLVLA